MSPSVYESMLHLVDTYRTEMPLIVITLLDTGSGS